MNERQQDRFNEWFKFMEPHESGEDDLKEAFMKGWDEATATFKDLLEQIKEDLDGVN